MDARDEEKKRWQERNTFYCRRLRAWLSPEACATNREKPVLRHGVVPDRYRPTPCGDCTDWRELCRQVELRRAGRDKEESVMANKIGVCLECGREKRVMGRGLCGACYMRLKKSGEIDVKYPLAPREAPAQTGEAVGKAAGCAGRACPLWSECVDLPGEEIPAACPALTAGETRPADEAGDPVPEAAMSPDGGVVSEGDVVERGVISEPADVQKERRSLAAGECPLWNECNHLGDGLYPVRCPAAAGEADCPLYYHSLLFDPAAAAQVHPLDLSRVAGLESYLRQRAEDNLRTLESEILVILKWAMQADQRALPAGGNTVWGGSAPGDWGNTVVSPTPLHTR